jgi:hypothetical protein
VGSVEIGENERNENRKGLVKVVSDGKCNVDMNNGDQNGGERE